MSFPPRRRGIGLLLALLAFAQFISAIDYNIVYVALPAIGREVGFDAHSLQWVVSGYAVAFGGFLLLGGALLLPATLSLIATTFAEGAERNRALAVWGGAGAVGLALGSLLGGILTNYLGWESVFYVNVPLALGAAAAAFAIITKDAPRERGRTFDLAGALTATIGFTALVLGCH